MLDKEPACPGAVPSPAATGGPDPVLHAQRRAIATIPRDDWDRLAGANPFAMPFSTWAFQRAWWDAYAANAHEETLAIVDVAGTLVAIAPLMHRHEVEPSDAVTHTTMRHGTEADLTPVPGSAKAVFFGASYHADYATLLAAPSDVGAVADAIATYLAGPDCGPWDVVDLRRLRCADPAGAALAAAFDAQARVHGWTLTDEREDVCPVVTFAPDLDLDGYLASLGKKERHEIRRKVRRAEAAGEVALVDSADPLVDLEVFIDLHQKRWGADGLFPPTPGGAQSRVLFRRAFELFGADGPLRLAFLTVGGRRIAAGVTFESEDALLYYNAGVDPDARDLSPGVVMVHAYVRRALSAGKRRLDFLRGDEPYKYEWGAVDEPIRRLLLRRRV